MTAYAKIKSLEENLGFFLIELADLQKSREANALFEQHEKVRKLDAEIAEIQETIDHLQAELDGLNKEYSYLKVA